MIRFNDWLARRVTDAVGTMWCAYLFAGLALVSLPDAIRGGTATLVSWVAQTFLQLVLLSVILVGQKIQADDAIGRHEELKEHRALLERIHERMQHRG